MTRIDAEVHDRQDDLGAAMADAVAQVIRSHRVQSGHVVLQVEGQCTVVPAEEVVLPGELPRAQPQRRRA